MKIDLNPNPVVPTSMLTINRLPAINYTNPSPHLTGDEKRQTINY